MLPTTINPGDFDHIGNHEELHADMIDLLARIGASHSAVDTTYDFLIRYGLEGIPFTNLKARGCVGDRVTDDTAAFEDAVDYALSGSGGTNQLGNKVVLMPPGGYRIEATPSLVNSLSNIEFWGTGPLSSYFFSAVPNGDPLLHLINPRKIGMRGIGLRNEGGNVPSEALLVERGAGQVGVAGTGSLYLEDVTVGGDSAHAFGTAIRYTDPGNRGDNDQGTFRNVDIYNCNRGYHFDSTNTLWHKIDGGVIAYCTDAAIDTQPSASAGGGYGGSFKLWSTRFLGNAVTYRIGPGLYGAINDIEIFGMAGESETLLVDTPSSMYASDVAAGSNGATLPQSTINVTTTAGSDASGWLYVNGSFGPTRIHYTGKSGTTFTGCTGGAGVLHTGDDIYAGGVADLAMKFIGGHANCFSSAADNIFWNGNNPGGALEMHGFNYGGASGLRIHQPGASAIRAFGGKRITSEWKYNGEVLLQGGVEVAAPTFTNLGEGDMIMLPEGYLRRFTIGGRPLTIGGLLPNLTAGNGVGAGGAVVGNGNEIAGWIRATTGGAPFATSAVWALNYKLARSLPAHVVVQPANAAARAAYPNGVPVHSLTTGFEAWNDGAALTPATDYDFTYFVMGLMP